MRAGPRKGAGFTLIEVLVAILLLGLMAAMAWQGVDGIVRARDASRDRLDRTLRLNTVIAQWEQDLASIQDTAVTPQALSCDGASVRLSRRTPDGVQIVAWTLRPVGAGGSSEWTRWSGPPTTTVGALRDSWLASLQLQGDEPGTLRMLDGLSQWQVYFYQGNGWANCQSTGDLATDANALAEAAAAAAATASAAAADAAASAASAAAPAGAASTPAGTRQALPAGVRLVLSFVPGSGRDGDLTRDVVLGP